VRIVNVILAAGYGTRMKSEIPKVLHSLLGRPLVARAVDTGRAATDAKPVLVVGHGRELIQQLIGDQADYAIQEDLLGTGHAVQQAAPLLRDQGGAVLVTYADMPLLRDETLQQLIAQFVDAHRQDPRVAVAMLSITRSDSQGFGRILRDNQGSVMAIVEEADCTPEQRVIEELNPGVYCFDGAWLWDNLGAIPESSKGEYYLTDMVGIAVAQGRKVVTLPAPVDEVDGINTRLHLAHATAVLRQRVLERHMLAGVTIVDPATTYIEEDVEIEPDAIIMPGCILQGQSRIGAHSTIGPYTQLVDSVIGRYCRVTFSVIEEAIMGDQGQIGPFGHLRPGAHLAEGVHMGNFGEVKNSYLGPGVKMGHFSYIGDAQVASNANIGAGTITCSFDGKQKNRTIIGEDAFIGSDTLLVAPVEIGARARTGAGSVVTRDVPVGALVYGVPARAPAAKGTGAEEEDENPQT
jgi:bifunctional UDP-N-acetylglucosamine pyrophosphorylase / glucosamine-1-phosphate N-acetyltransferase